jgi:predicted DNA-binding transcriptional regulator YafY
MTTMVFGPPVKIDYTNHRGERAIRTIFPLATYYDGQNKYHGAAWILRAFDCGKCEVREFALKNVHRWECEE